MDTTSMIREAKDELANATTEIRALRKVKDAAKELRAAMGSMSFVEFAMKARELDAALNEYDARGGN